MHLMTAPAGTCSRPGRKETAMRSNILKKTLTMMLAFAMVFTMTPLLGVGAQEVHAATATISGGTIKPDGTGVNGVFGSNASYDSDTNTISLSNDIVLTSPIVIKKDSVSASGQAEKTLTLNLDGHSIMRKAGVAGTDLSKAQGGNAIEIAPADFNVVIKGPGSVTGGAGAVYETSTKNRYGTDGGMAVCIIDYGNGSYWYPDRSVNNGKLNYGLTVTGGAVITGGAGADLRGSDLLNNIEKYSGYRSDIYTSVPFEAGAGGAGLGQHVVRTTYGDPCITYNRVEVENGTVTGGRGGMIDLSDITPTEFATMTSAAAEAAMQGKNNKDYKDQVIRLMAQYPGDGGSGLLIGAGRKYVYVASGSTVSGGISGTWEYGNKKYINDIGAYDALVHEADGGTGISVNAGDLGLTDSAVTWGANSYSSKTKDSDDMGIYIAGTVKGGDGGNADASSERAGNGGLGIFMNGDGDRYETDIAYPTNEDYKKLGIVAIAEGGSVSGGNGGNAVSGSGGRGGNGIMEYYERESDRTYINAYGTDYYIVNGTLNGGGGGNSKHIFAGSGGNGMAFKNYRDHVRIAGSGKVSGGAGGIEVVRTGENGSSSDKHEALRFYPEKPDNVVSVNTSEGGAIQGINKDKIDVTASMTAFDKNPTTSTRLSCNIDLPAGYSGGVYIQWIAGIYEVGTYPYTEYIIESSGTNYTSFNLLNNNAYKYLAYPTYSQMPDLGNEYNYDVATTDRMSEPTTVKTDIYCKVMLEDGRWGKSNVMTFERGKGWDGTGGGSGGDDSGQGDMEELLSVINMIDDLPSAGSLTLSDAAEVRAARAAFNALSDEQLAMVDPNELDRITGKLEAAEAKINDLEKAYTVENDISLLAGRLEASVDDGTIVNDIKETAKDSVAATRQEFEDLTDEQKALVPQYSKDMLEEAELVVAKDGDEYITAVGTFLNQYAPIDISNAEVTFPAAEYEYNGKAQKPPATVKLGGNTLVKDTDYYLLYDSNLYPGTAIVTAVGMGRYSGEAYGTFEITDNSPDDPPGPDPGGGGNVQPPGTVTPSAPAEIQDLPAVRISKPKAGKKKVTVKWKKPKKNVLKQIQGIEIRVTGPGVDKTTTAGKKKTSKKIGGLKSKKKYTVQIRAYKNDGGVKHVSAWKSKTVKVK